MISPAGDAKSARLTCPDLGLPDPCASPRPGDGVWNDIWGQRCLREKDGSVLDRERKGPRWALIRTAILRKFGRIAGLRSIELGCGRGDLSALLAQEGADVTLLDASTMALQHAAARFRGLQLPATSIHADMRALPTVLKGRFDLVLSLGVIEHFRGAARDRALRAHFDVLHRGGLGMVGVPNAACPPYRLWKTCLETIRWWPYGLEIPYTRRELKTRAVRAGFRRVDIACTGFWQAVGDFWLGGLLRRPVDWATVRSRFDRRWGANLVLIADRPEDGEAGAPCTLSS